MSITPEALDELRADLIRDYEHAAFSVDVAVSIRRDHANKLTSQEHNAARRRVIKAALRWLEDGRPDNPDASDYLDAPTSPT